jgi:Phosphotransferase enzyme family
VIEANAIAQSFRQAGLDPAAFVYVPKPGPPTPMRIHVGEDSVFTVALSAEGRRQNLIEHTCREWAAQHGIDCPTVLGFARTGDWLHAERVRAQRPEGSAYVNRALDAADHIARSEPPVLPVPPTQWRAGHLPRLRRTFRGILGGLNIRDFLRSRRAAAELTDLTTCHGDFYRRNVLFRASGQVSIVDWEFVGLAPRWTDHLRIWSTLRRAEDRAESWNRILASCSPSDTGHLDVLMRWLCHRLLAENLAAPRHQRDREDLEHAHRLMAEARSISAELR